MANPLVAYGAYPRAQHQLGMSLRVVHLTSVHSAGDTRIFHKQCRTLARAGCDVVLVAVAGADSYVDGVRLRAVPRPRSRSERMTLTAWNVLRQALRERNAIAHIHDPELIPVGVVLRLLGRKVIYDAHEDIAVNFRTKNWIPKGLRTATALAGEGMTRAAGYIFNAVIAATPTIATRYPARRTTVIHNYPVLEDFAQAARRRQPSRTIMYCGAIANDRGAAEMVRAMDSAAMPAGLCLVLAGPIESAALHEQLQNLPGWQHVKAIGRVNAKDVPQLLSQAAVGLATLHPTQAYLEALPTKLYEYAAAGTPIVCSDFPLWRTIVGDGGARFVNPLDPDAIARAVADIIADPQAAAAMAARAQATVLENYAWEREGARLVALYDRLGARSGVTLQHHCG